MDEAREHAMMEAFSRFVATLAVTRTQLLVREGNHLSDVEANPPMYIEGSPGCRSCKRPTNGRVLCSTCRATPLVEHGPPLFDTMFRSSHKKYDIRPGSEKETILVMLHAQKAMATDAYRLAEQLVTWCGSVYTQWHRSCGGISGNVLFTPELVNSGGSYRRSVLCGAPGALNRSVVVGGLGPILQTVVKQSVIEWLYAVDAALRAEFEIPLSREAGDTSLMANLASFATLIANRVVLMEDTSDDDPTQYLCTLSCEHLAKIQYVRCEYFAQLRIKRDISAMRMLVKIASKQELESAFAELVEDTKGARSVFLEMLQDPPPEMLVALPTFVVDMNFTVLRDVIGLLPSDGIDATMLAIDAWRASVPTELLCARVNQAIHAAHGWKPCFLGCLEPVNGIGKTVASSLCLPAMGWVDGAKATARWRLIGHATHRQRRTGLDPTGLRIVLMSAALIQLMACDAPGYPNPNQFFCRGSVRCDVLHRVVHGSMQTSLHAIEALRDQMRPLSMGIEWIHGREQIRCWQNSHVDQHVRKALSLLGGFSYQELSARFLGTVETLCDDCGERSTPGGACCSEWCGSRHMTTQRTISESSHAALMPKVTQLMLPLKPKEGYDDWLGLSVKIALPLLLQLRQSLGFSLQVRTNPIGDILRMFPEIRSWKPSDGEVSLTQKQVYDEPVVKQLLTAKDRNNGLAVTRRVRTKVLWIFNPTKLQSALGTL